MLIKTSMLSIIYNYMKQFNKIKFNLFVIQFTHLLYYMYYTVY